MTFKELRKSKGLTQQYALQYLQQNGIKISISTLIDKEFGRRKFTAKEAQLLCALYDVDLSQVTC